MPIYRCIWYISPDGFSLALNFLVHHLNSSILAIRKKLLMGKRDLKNRSPKKIRIDTSKNVHRLNVRGLVVRFFAHGKTGLENRGRRYVWYSIQSKCPPRYFFEFFPTS
jgi:hypothetical protein